MLRAALLCCLFLSACGFKPVYGQQDMDDSGSSKLASVEVERMNGRQGQVLQNKLEDLLAPNGAASPEYTIKIALKTERHELGIRGDLRVTRYDLVSTANYQLIRLIDNREVDTGRVTIKSSFNRTNSEFSTFVAEEDAAAKAADELAQEIRSRLVYYFSK